MRQLERSEEDLMPFPLIRIVYHENRGRKTRKNLSPTRTLIIKCCFPLKENVCFYSTGVLSA